MRFLWLCVSAALALTVLHVHHVALPYASGARHRPLRLSKSLTIVENAAPERVVLVPPPEPAHESRASRVRGASVATHRVANETSAEALQRARQTSIVPLEWRRRRSVAFADYIALHAAILRGDRSDGSLVRRRYILVQPCCQLCNRVRVLISALALGILTGRAVLMDFDGMGKGSGKGSDYYGRLDDLFDSPLRVQSTKTPHELQATAGGERSLAWLELMTGFICQQPLLWDEPVVVIQGSPAFLHSLFLNPSLREAFEAAFGGLDGLFAALFFELLQPHAALLNEARDFVRRRALDGATTAAAAATSGRAARLVEQPAFVVGLHVRNGRDFRTKKITEEEWKQLAACAQALVPRAAQPGEGWGGKGGRGRQRASYVIATESAESQAAATAALGQQATVYKASLPKGSHGGSSSREGAKRALVELLIVSLSNASVLTPMSSFSETAAALAGRPGLYFHFDTSRKFHHESAVEAVSGCFVPWTAEMPGSMNLHSLLKELRCADEVRRTHRESPWVEPTGLRFLDGSAVLPERLAKKVTAF